MRQSLRLALVDADGTLVAKRQIGDDAAGFAVLLQLLADAGDSSEEPIPVAIETSRGLLVACLRATARDDLRAARNELTEELVQPVEDTGPLMGQIVTTLGEQPQDNGLILRRDQAQRRVVQGNLRDAASVGGISLAATAAGQQPSAHRQRRGHVHHVFARGRQSLGDPSPEPKGRLHGEPPLRPALGPQHHLLERSGVDNETTAAHLGGSEINCHCGQR